MVKAFVLINTEGPAHETDLNQLKNLTGVISVNLVYGIYDLVCHIQVKGMVTLKDLVFKKIRLVEHVTSTVTLICDEIN